MVDKTGQPRSSVTKFVTALHVTDCAVVLLAGTGDFLQIGCHTGELLAKVTHAAGCKRCANHFFTIGRAIKSPCCRTALSWFTGMVTDDMRSVWLGVTWVADLRSPPSETTLHVTSAAAPRCIAAHQRAQVRTETRPPYPKQQRTP